MAAAFVVLYSTLVFIVWGGWRTINRQEARFRGLIEGLGEGILVVDRQGTIRYANERIGQLLGRSAGALIGRRWDTLSPSHADQLQALSQAITAGTTPEAVELEFYRPDGRRIYTDVRATPLSAWEAANTVCAIADVTFRKRAERQLHEAHAALEEKVAELEAAKRELQAVNAQLEHDAFHDGLTGIANRALFLDRLGHALDRCRHRTGRNFAVLYLDFDRFKVINDSLGHHIGDQLLVAIAGKLSALIRPSDTAARLGGDEFTVLMEDLAGVDEAVALAEALNKTFLQPIRLGPHELHTSASIGIVVSEPSFSSAEDVLRAADIAMYRAKAQGRARCQVFDQSMYARAISLMSLEQDLYGALERRELEVHYLPIVSLSDGRLSGFEAVVRWRHPSHGLISPADFVPLAEETGLILDIDRWVLRESCLQVKRWQQSLPAFATVRLSTNLSAQHFHHPALADDVREILHDTGFDPALLCLEITETVMLRQRAAVHATLEALKRMQVELHIDDFGTGYSSLSYLRQLPVDALKIDRSFIEQVHSSPESASLVQAILHMADNLGVRVIAEGIETPPQLRALQGLGCAEAQGFLFSRPLPASDMAALMRTRRDFLPAAARAQVELLPP